MDHKEAVQLQAAEKYVLGELTQPLREEYEEHFFDCAECALDVRAAVAFAENARGVLREQEREAEAKTEAPVGSGWFAWLRPAVAVPAFAVLLLALGYQSLVSVPHWKKAAEQAATSRVLPMFSLIAANTRGPEGQVVQVAQGQPFGLYIDVPADASYQTYLLRLEDPEGQSTILRSLSYEEAQKTQVVEVHPAKLAGAYRVVILGLSAPGSDAAKETTLATMKFIVEFEK